MAEKCVCHINGYQIKDATARATLENHTPRIAAVETTTRSLVESADDHELRIAAIENSAPSTDDGSSSASNHESRIIQLESDVALNMYNINDHNNRITALEEKESSYQTIHQELLKDTTENADAITELQSRTTAAEIAIDTHGDEIANLQEEIDSVKSTNATQTTNISNLTSRVTAVETKNTSQDSDITTIKSDISSIKSTNTTQATNISDMDTRINNVELKNAAQDENLLSLASRVSDLENNSTDGTSFDPLSIYPVGSIYLSTTTTSPASTIGGTWTQLKDRFLVGAGNKYSLNQTGGYTDLIVPTHYHSGLTIDSAYVIKAKTIGSGSGNTTALGIETTSTGGNAVQTGSTGSTGTNRNLPPYQAVYIWKRSA